MLDFIFNNWPIIFLVSAVLIAWCFAKLMLGDEKLPYQKRGSLLTQSELAFYKALQQAVDGKWAIQAMVRLADLLNVVPDTPKPQSWQNRIHAKHVDFLLCDHGTMEAKLCSNWTIRHTSFRTACGAIGSSTRRWPTPAYPC